MSDLLITTLIIAYAATGIISTIGYFPTIKDLWVGNKMSANTSSYMIWTACALVSFLYSIFILKDLLLRIVSGLNFACCATIWIMCIFFKHKNSIN